MPLDLNWFSCFRNLVSYFQIMMMRNSGSHDKPNGVMDITFWRGGNFHSLDSNEGQRRWSLK